ncbi:hypothetical protein Taqua_02385 [Tepidimonas aquatica]|uniref:Uncharacterized protein n=1 Tax=Tepidimonas aquatica TaxID=247482 RepID=A0A554WAX4_9BURK|nr:hypothetical protein Taqua_02385 [Tepidimonas aquatica]
MIWLSVKRDFFMVEILLRDSLLLSALVLRGDYPPLANPTTATPNPANAANRTG